MTITSTAFQQGEYIPQEYSCEGDNINPPLTFSEVPKEAKSLVLVLEDPDAPTGTFIHWLLYDMTPATLQILPNATPQIGRQGKNDFGKTGYAGPCPPAGKHRYFFKLFALDQMLDFREGSTSQLVYEALEGHIIDKAELMGLYEKASEPSQTLARQRLDEYTDDRDTLDGQLISK